MRGRMSGSRVTVLHNMLHKPLFSILSGPGKVGLTWGGRYWVRTSDLFGVNQVPPSVYAGQTSNPLVRNGQQRPTAASGAPRNRVCAPRAPQDGG